MATTDLPPGAHLGWISPQERTQAQHDAHSQAVSRMCAFTLQAPSIPKGAKVILTDLWRDPLIIGDIGQEFTGFHQLTGSCFKAGTLVQMPHGTKPIEEVQAGDEVITHQSRRRKVITPTSRDYTGVMCYLKLVLTDGGHAHQVVATADHKFLTAAGEWVEVGQLPPRAEVVFRGQPVRLADYQTSLNVTNEKVYCLKVEEDESFIANGFTAHNCVGVSLGNGEATLSFVQRKLAVNPTRAFVPFWPFPYGRTRYNEGDSGQGEGAVDSVAGDTLMKEGVFDINQPGLPKFQTDDGWYLTEQLEYQWSDGASISQSWMTLGKQYPLGGHAALNSPDDIKAAVLNGYPVLDGCNNFVGNGSITGSGDNAYVVGAYDGQGGHSTCILGYWEHPNDGPLFLYSNQWPTSTYPKDPAGAGRCCVWIPLSETAKLFQTGGSGGETMALSHQTYLPAQPAVLDLWLI